MATLTIKNIPDDLYRDLKRAAGAHRRSINSQVISCLEATLRSRPIDVEKFLTEARAGRRDLGVYLTDADLRKAKKQGRP
jgi:plasmid stability protein